MSRDDKVRDEIEVALMIIVVFLCLLIASLAFGQEKPVPDIPLPPDIIHVHHVGCKIDAHHSEPPIYVLNAKTGEEEEAVMWWVTLFAKYVDLPDGTKREDWEPKDPLGKYPGTTSDMNGASVACGQWMAREKATQKKEILSMGHSVKK